MVKVNKIGILLEKTGLEFENEGVLNPAVIREGDSVHVFYRAVQEGIIRLSATVSLTALLL